jgi:hypothetical protein
MRAMPNPNAQTTSVTVTLTLDSSVAGPPYEILNCSTYVTFSDNSNTTLPGWGIAAIGTPQSSGAPFALVLKDQNTSPITGVVNWSLTCIPRAPTTAASPFSNNAASIAGAGSTPANGGGFQLNFANTNDPGTRNPKINNSGTWDWSLMVQVTCADGTVRCYGSDPEMEVGP